MALTNKLDCRFDYAAVDRQYDIYQITTSEKYIAYGASFLDIPTENLKAVSLAYDQGKNAYVMFKKDAIERLALALAIKDNQSLSISKVSAAMLPPFVLPRLFLYSLANYCSPDNMFNNLGGKLFLTIPAWRKANGQSLKALEITIDRDLQLNAKATTFTLASKFKKGTKGVAESPKYLLAVKGNFRRALANDDLKQAYINKGLPGRKTELPFLDLKIPAIRQTKAYFLNRVINMLNGRYGGLLVFSFLPLSKDKQVVERKDADFPSRSLSCVASHKVYLTSRLNPGEAEAEFTALRSSLSRALGNDLLADSADIRNDDMEIVFIHNQDYYQGKNDPYTTLARDHVVQCVTLEDGAERIEAETPAVISTVFKEMTIKNDILNTHRITLDDWASFNFKGNWYFGEEKSGQRYFMTIHPDGTFVFEKPVGLMARYRDPVLSRLDGVLAESDLKGKVIVMNDQGDINLISRTNAYCLPNPEIYELASISRSKASRDRYLDGLVDINLFHDEEGRCFYNAGLPGSGMNTAVPKANILYQVTVVDGRNIIEDILYLMAVAFVKYNSFTVLPYPIKYLREYMLLNGSKAEAFK